MKILIPYYFYMYLFVYSGILMDTTIDNKLFHIPDDNKQNCLSVE